MATMADFTIYRCWTHQAALAPQKTKVLPNMDKAPFSVNHFTEHVNHVFMDFFSPPKKSFILKTRKAIIFSLVNQKAQD